MVGRSWWTSRSRVRSLVADARTLATRFQILREAGLDPSAAERRAFAEALAGSEFQPTLGLYERFLLRAKPEARRQHGVYFTPPAVVGAQVRLVDALLRQRLGARNGLGDPNVAIVDPATGSGAYPLAILGRTGLDAARRMWLFETQPGAAALARAQGVSVQEGDALSATLILDAPIAVCIGNPPYRRRAVNAVERAALADMADPKNGIHRKSLYNEYVYFWRWALGIICEQRRGPGVVCFLTAASYLRGPGFGGMRRLLRAAFDEIWLIDLEGDQRAGRASHNVFAIRTPIALALCARFGDASTQRPARVHYARVDGTTDEKLAYLDGLRTLQDLEWTAASREWQAPLVPSKLSAYAQWPALTDLFPWQLSGAQLKRTWPIGITPDVLRSRWRRLLDLQGQSRREAFGPTRDRDIDSAAPDLFGSGQKHVPLGELSADAACPEPRRYAYRAFDRQWVLPDARCGDFMRPSLWQINGVRQLFLTSMLTNVLGRGPAAVVTALVPDLDHFRGSFGARGVIPLWRDAAGTLPNVDAAIVGRLNQVYGFEVTPQALMAYCYALLAAPSYTQRFEEELRTPGPRLPFTRNAQLFMRAAALGEALIRLHTYREVRVGTAQLLEPVTEYPTDFSYNAGTLALRLGDGLIAPVQPEAWSFGVSGYRVLKNWLRRRTSTRGKSALDRIAQHAWTAELTRELLELIWLLEATHVIGPALDALLDEAVSN